MTTEQENFAFAAAAAIQNQQQALNEAAPSAEGGTEAAGEDPILKYAETLKGIGVTPEQAREFQERLAYMQTPQGQSQYFESFLASEQGAPLRERFGREFLADMLNREGGPERIVNLAREFGAKIPVADPVDDDTPAEIREIKALKAQQQALEAKINQLNQTGAQRIQQLEGALRGREENEARVAAISDWAKTVPPMASQAFKAVAARAWEKQRLDPESYRGPIGIKRAAADAYAELNSLGQYFQPKRAPRAGGPGDGGGVTAGLVDESKRTLKDWIEAASDQYARDSRNEE